MKTYQVRVTHDPKTYRRLPKERVFNWLTKEEAICEGHVTCPKTGKEQCGKVVVFKMILLKDGTGFAEPETVVCFGCGERHNVVEKES